MKTFPVSRRWWMAAASLLALSAMPTVQAAEVTIYNSDFTPTSTKKRLADSILTGTDALTGVSWKWMVVDEDDEPIGVDKTPNGNYFLGHHQTAGDRMDELGMDNHIVNFDLAGLQQHDGVKLEFDLYAIHEWDGDDGGVRGMPDYFGASVDRNGTGETLVLSTFSNRTDRSQSYPGGLFARFPDGYDAGMGAAALDSLGYDRNGGSYEGFADAVYHFSFMFDHDSSDLALSFFASVNDVMKESWGLDNVKVTLTGVNSAEVAAVPVPGALVFMLSGLGAALTRLRKRAA